MQDFSIHQQQCLCVLLNCMCCIHLTDSARRHNTLTMCTVNTLDTLIVKPSLSQNTVTVHAHESHGHFHSKTNGCIRNLLRSWINFGRATLFELQGAWERWEEPVRKYINAKNRARRNKILLEGDSGVARSQRFGSPSPNEPFKVLHVR